MFLYWVCSAASFESACHPVSTNESRTGSAISWTSGGLDLAAVTCPGKWNRGSIKRTTSPQNIKVFQNPELIHFVLCVSRKQPKFKFSISTERKRKILHKPAKVLMDYKSTCFPNQFVFCWLGRQETYELKSSLCVLQNGVSSLWVPNSFSLIWCTLTQ